MEQPDSQPKLVPQTTILVDFPSRPGVKAVTSKPEALAERSATAIDAAMNSIQNLADRISLTVQSFITRPKEVEVEFGVKLDAEAGALIARTGVEAHMTVTLKWSSDKGDDDENGEHPSAETQRDYR